MIDYQQNIERSILASYIFSDVKLDLDDMDFFYMDNRKIAKIIKELIRNKIDVNELEILKRDESLENAMLEVMVTNPLSNCTSYLKQLRENRILRELKKISLHIEHSSIPNEIIKTIEKSLDNIKNTNTNSLDVLRNLDINNNDFNLNIELLVDKFLVKNTLNMWFAIGGKGKSLLALSVCIKLLQNSLISEVFYLDMDNSLMALKNRGLDKLKLKYHNLRYIHKMKIDSPKKLLKQFSDIAISDKEAFRDKLIVVDSIRDFLGGSDVNSDSQVTPILDQLKNIREAGATVIFLHHISKGGIESKQSKGATAFRDSVDCSYYIDSNKIKENLRSYTLTNDKDRIGVLENVAFELEVNTMNIKLGNYEIATMNDKESEFVASVKNILSELNGITQNEILKKLDKIADKTSMELLKKYNEIFWLTRKGDKNANLYFLIKSKSIQNGIETTII
jgi:replicative DNA helicase